MENEKIWAPCTDCKICIRNVSNPKRYVELLAEYAEQPGNATEIAGIDLYQVLAGAPSGVTHVVVISAEKRYQFMERYNSPEFTKYLRKFASVREVLGVNYADNISFSGELSIETLRKATAAWLAAQGGYGAELDLAKSFDSISDGCF